MYISEALPTQYHPETYKMYSLFFSSFFFSFSFFVSFCYFSFLLVFLTKTNFYKSTFEEQGVDGEILLSLTEQDMKDDLGVKEERKKREKRREREREEEEGEEREGEVN